MRMLKRALPYLLAVYMIIGVFLSALMHYAIPAMNWMGCTYYALTWPAFVASGTFGAPAPPVPTWVFTFEEEGR